MRYLIMVVWFFAAVSAAAQSLTLKDCYALADQHYPLMKQKALIAQAKKFTIDNILKGNLPQLAIHGQATHQSGVTQIPIALPNTDIPTVSRDQFRLYGELIQPLTDLLIVKKHKHLQQINSSIQEQQLDVERDKLKERVNQLFFGILLIDEQLKQNALLKKDIQTGMARVEAAIANGTELKSSLDKLKAEWLRADQHTIELQSSRKAYREMLGLLINHPMDENTVLEKPEALVLRDTITRTELKVYDFQQRSAVVNDKLIGLRNLPKFSLFFQAGFGRPSPVNMLSNEFSSYYLGGLRLTWALSSFYTSGTERQLQEINQQMIGAQRETFVFNTDLLLKQQYAEIKRLHELINKDDEIIALRAAVKEAANAQLANGVITVNDFLKEVNAEDQARQSKILHEIQLLMAEYNYQVMAGN